MWWDSGPGLIEAIFKRDYNECLLSVESWNRNPFTLWSWHIRITIGDNCELVNSIEVESSITNQLQWHDMPATGLQWSSLHRGYNEYLFLDNLRSCNAFPLWFWHLRALPIWQSWNDSWRLGKLIVYKSIRDTRFARKSNIWLLESLILLKGLTCLNCTGQILKFHR